MIRGKAFLLFAVAVLVPASLYGAGPVDWKLAASAFLANRADGTKPPTGKGAARCAAYWLIHADALKRGAFPKEAVAQFDSEIAVPDEGATNVMVFSGLNGDIRSYEKSKGEAIKLQDKLFAGDAKALKSYFATLGKCSFGSS
jgi:hypothetical protein